MTNIMVLSNKEMSLKMLVLEVKGIRLLENALEKSLLHVGFEHVTLDCGAEV